MPVVSHRPDDTVEGATMSKINSTTVPAPRQPFPKPRGTISVLFDLQGRPNSVTLRMLDALIGAPNGLAPDELQQRVYGYPADGYARDPFTNLRAIVCHYNRGRVKHAPPGRVVSKGGRYYFAAPDQIKALVLIPTSLMIDGTRLICRVENGRLIVEGKVNK